MKRHSKINDQVDPVYLSMIQTIITHQCPQCGSEQMVKNGHDYKGAQKYYCQNCASYGTLNAQRGYDERTRAQVKRAVRCHAAGHSAEYTSRRGSKPIAEET